MSSKGVEIASGPYQPYVSYWHLFYFESGRYVIRVYAASDKPESVFRITQNQAGHLYSNAEVYYRGLRGEAFQ